MIGCPDCCLFFTGVSQNWLLLEHRTTAHGSAAADYPGPDPGGPDVTAPLDWVLDTAGRDQ